MPFHLFARLACSFTQYGCRIDQICLQGAYIQQRENGLQIFVCNRFILLAAGVRNCSQQHCIVKDLQRSSPFAWAIAPPATAR